MKKSIKKIVVCGVALSIITGSSFALFKSNSVSASPEFKITHPFNNSKYNENPSPTLKNNKDKISKDLLKKDDILKKVEKEQIKTQKSSIKKVELKIWNQHITQDDPNNKDKFFQVDPNRQVYVVVTQYPDGIDTKAGFYANATLTTVYDAETGQLLKSAVTGNYQGKGLNH